MAFLRLPNIRIGEVPFTTRGRAYGHSSAFNPSAVRDAVFETVRGVRSVAKYRRKMVLSQHQDDS